MDILMNCLSKSLWQSISLKKKKKKLQKTKEYWVGAIKFSHGESLYKTKGSKERIMDLPLIWWKLSSRVLLRILLWAAYAIHQLMHNEGEWNCERPTSTTNTTRSNLDSEDQRILTWPNWYTVAQQTPGRASVLTQAKCIGKNNLYASDISPGCKIKYDLTRKNLWLLQADQWRLFSDAPQ